MLPLKQGRPLLLGIAFSCAACGGGPTANIQPPPPPADFSISVSASSVSLTQGATSSPVSISVTPENGFSGSVQVSLSGAPAGVTSNPTSPFSVNSGASVPVIFAAAGNAATGTFSVSVQGISGALSHSAGMTLSIQQGVTAVLPRTTFFRTDALAAQDNPPGESHHQRMAYDSARKQLYVANRAMNRVEIFSTSTLTRAAQISVPGATSVDLSADGATLWVGTVTNNGAAVDPAGLQVRALFAVPPVTPIPNTVFDRPEEIISAANGNAYLRLRHAAQPEALLALWNPAANSVTNLTSVEPQLFQSGLGAMARSADHTKFFVAAADSSGEVAIFDASGNPLAGPRGLGAAQIPYVAANADGSLFAAVLAMNGSPQLVLLDAALNTVASAAISGASGPVFSRDGQTVYLPQAGAIEARSAADLRLLGSAPDIGGGLPSQLEAADETQMLFALSNRGVAFLDAAHPAALPSSVPVFAAAPAGSPAEGPNTGGTAVSFAGQNFPPLQQLNFGSQAAADAAESSSTQILATAPASVLNGPVNVTAYFSNGWLSLAPDAFSYGPQILQVVPNSGKAAGGDAVQIYGYGFGADPAKLAVKIGGANASVQSIDTAPAISSALNLTTPLPFPIERLTLATPAGAAGNANITIAAPSGAATLANGFQFLPSVQFFGKPGLCKFILYDQHRNWLYLSDIDHVDVFDIAAQQFRPTPLQAPGGPPPTAGLRGLALAPDGSRLVVADFGSQLVYLLNPDTGGGTTVSTGGVAGYAASGPARVAATSAQSVFIGLSGEGGSGIGCSSCLGQLNLTASPLVFQPATEPQVTSISGAPLLASSASGDQVFVAFASAPGGPLASWSSSAANAFTTVLANSVVSDLGAAGDGTVFASAVPAGVEIRNANLSLTAVPSSYELAQIRNRSNVPGIALHPSGALIYQPFLTGAPGAASTRGGIDVLDAHSGALRLRIALPQQLMTDVDGLHGDFLAIDENGQRLFAITSSDGSPQNAGVTIVTLAAVPLGIGTVSPQSGPAAGGTTLTIRGSGFQSGATVQFNGKAASVTFKDKNTLTVTTPALTAGPQQITITNPDGQSYTLDAAFNAN